MYRVERLGKHEQRNGKPCTVERLSRSYVYGLDSDGVGSAWDRDTGKLGVTGKDHHDIIGEWPDDSNVDAKSNPAPIPLAEMTREDFEGVGLEHKEFDIADDDTSWHAISTGPTRDFKLEANEDYVLLELPASVVTSETLRQLKAILDGAGKTDDK